MKILSLFLFFVLIPFLTQAADGETDWTAETPTWRKVEDFRAQAEASRQDGYDDGAPISVSTEADGAWELLKEADDHRLTFHLSSFTHRSDSGDADLRGEPAVEALIGALLENTHGGQRLFSQMAAFKEFLQGASQTAFTPRQLAEAITAGIEAGTSAMESHSHDSKEVVSSWACRGPLFYAIYNGATRVEEEVE